MPSKGAKEIERAIGRALRKCKCPPAVGVWFIMRYEIENNSRHRGHLQLGGLPASLEMLSDPKTGLVRYSSEKVFRLFSRLSKITIGRRLPKPLVELTDQGQVYSYWLRRLADIRASGRRRMKKSRERSALRVSRDTLKENKGVTKGVTSPPNGFPPTTPLPYPPPSPLSGGDAPTVSAASRLEGWEFSGSQPSQNGLEFREAFAEWVLAQRDKGKLSPLSVRAQLSRLSAVPTSAQVKALREAVANNWAGPRLDGDRRNGHGATPRRATSAVKSASFDHGPARPGKD